MPCEFLHEAHHLGWLDDDGDGDSLAGGTKVDLPVYLASELARANHVVVLRPLLFGPQTRNSLRADAEVVNLRDKSEFFFTHGLRVAELTEDEALPVVLSEAFRVRYRRMLDTCLTGADGDPGGLTHRLSATEGNRARRPARAPRAPRRSCASPPHALARAYPPVRPRRAPPPAASLLRIGAVFRIGLTSLKDYHRWKARQASHITACDVIRQPAKKPRQRAAA